MEIGGEARQRNSLRLSHPSGTFKINVISTGFAFYDQKGITEKVSFLPEKGVVVIYLVFALFNQNQNWSIINHYPPPIL